MITLRKSVYSAAALLAVSAFAAKAAVINWENPMDDVQEKIQQVDPKTEPQAVGAPIQDQAVVPNVLYIGEYEVRVPEYGSKRHPGENRYDDIHLASLRMLEENDIPDPQCWNANEGPAPCGPPHFSPILKDGDAIVIEYTNCEVVTNLEYSGSGCGSTIRVPTPLKAHDGAVYWGNEIVAKVSGHAFGKGLKLQNGYSIKLDKTASVKERVEITHYRECAVSDNEYNSCRVYSGKILEDRAVYHDTILTVRFYLVKGTKEEKKKGWFKKLL